MSKPRYSFKIFGNNKTSPFDLKEVILRVFKLHEVSSIEVDLFRLHFDSASTLFGKMNVVKEWVEVNSITKEI